MADPALEFAVLARALKDAGETGLRRELFKAINDAGQTVGKEIRNVEHLKPYMPDRYAEILAGDLALRVSKRTGTNPGVTLRALGRVRNRHVARINEGILRHPVYGTEAQVEAAPSGRHGAGWTWVSQDIRGGFFDDPVERAGPEVRRQIEDAVQQTIRKITG